jgi:hypothetical protein
MIIKTQAMIIIYSSSVAADAPAIYIAGQQVPYSKSVKDLGLRRLWSTASPSLGGS